MCPNACIQEPAHFLKLACLPNMSLRWTVHVCPNACTHAPAHFWSLPVSQTCPCDELYMCAQMFVYMHQHIFEACLSRNNISTINFACVPKRLYASTSAFLKLAFLPNMSYYKLHICAQTLVYKLQGAILTWPRVEPKMCKPCKSTQNKACAACVKIRCIRKKICDCNFDVFFNAFEAHGAGASMYVMIWLILRRRPNNNYNALLYSLLGVFWSVPFERKKDWKS